MRKRYVLTTLTLVALFLFLSVGWSTGAWGMGSNPPQPQHIESPQRVPASAATGFYIVNNTWNMLPPQDYHAVGTFYFWTWEHLNPLPGVYRFNFLDDYVNQAMDAGYQSIGIAITTYYGRAARYLPCSDEFNQGYSQTPAFVRWGPNGIDESSDGDADTGDDPVIIADTPDTRDCNGDGVPDPWLLPKYTDPYYQEQYQIFVERLAEHLLNAPYRDRIAWVALGTGKDGENIPVDNMDDDSLKRVISRDDWVNFVKHIIDIYYDAFSAGSAQPRIPLLLQNAPFYLDKYERPEVAAYAHARDIGISVNSLNSDFDLTEAGAAGNYIGMYDQIRQYGDDVPVALEGYGYMMATENEFYWAMARALDLQPDFLRLSSFWSREDTPTNRTIAQWASRYIGKGLAPGQPRPPTIWSRMREHRVPIYLAYVGAPIYATYWPSIGNYEYFLHQDFTAPHGVTIPYTDDPRFQASDHRFGTSQTPNVKDQPWHYNEDAYSADLNRAGLYHVEVVKPDAVPVQTQVDPGWTARRSDQASGNYGFFFNADDRYLAPPADLQRPHEVRITVTFLDKGTDRWRLMYDGVNGEKAATLYALQDWDVAKGLALQDGLPTSGVLPEPRPTYVQKTNTYRWKVATFYITDGYFGNRLPGGNDFYIDSRSDAGMMDGDEFIHHVDVQSLNDIPQTTPTPTPLPTSTPGTTPTPWPTTTPQPTATPTPTPTTGQSISGYVFENKNGDFIKDPDEPGLPGALLRLYRTDQLNTPVAQTVTDNAGFYRFANVGTGTYVLLADPPAGWRLLQSSRYVVINEDQHLTHQDFPAERLATPTANPSPTATPTPTGGRIYGVVFNDRNGNGLQDGDEPGIPGMTIKLDTVTGQPVAEAQTDSLGQYAFNDLMAQSYHLYVVVPAGWTPTSVVDYYLNPGNRAVERNFGLQPPPPTPTPLPTGQLIAFAWNDLNQDGRIDPGEPPLAGAQVIVYDATGEAEIDRGITDGDGRVIFDLPAPNDYLITYQPPLGMAPSTPTQYSILLNPGTELEIPFGSYDAFPKLYLPQILTGN